LLFGSLQKQRDDIGKSNIAFVVGIKSGLHLADLFFCGAMAYSTDEGRKVAGRYATRIFFIKDREQLLIVNEFFFREIFESINFHLEFKEQL
jgi:hypothetical protein